MKKILLISLTVSCLAIIGCSNSALTQCQDQNASLKAKISQLEQNLAEEKVAHQKDVEKFKAESIEMQTTAMQSITSMLSKDKAIQDKLQAQVNDLTQARKALETQVNTLTAEIQQMKTPPAQVQK